MIPVMISPPKAQAVSCDSSFALPLLLNAVQ